MSFQDPDEIAKALASRPPRQEREFEQWKWGWGYLEISIILCVLSFGLILFRDPGGTVGAIVSIPLFIALIYALGLSATFLIAYVHKMIEEFGK